MGGAGFIGSHLCDTLLALGHEVVALDDFCTGSQTNVAHLTKNKRFTLVTHDVTVAFHLPTRRIYNLACPASPVHYQANAVKTTLTSVLGTLHALELAQAHDARIFLASTSEVYGDPDVHPQPETYHGNVNPVGVRACYDEGKRCAESLAMDFQRERGVSVRIARIFNTYGPRMAVDDGRVVSNFILQALRGEDLTVYGDSQQTRSFCYVDDLVDGLMRLMEHPKLVGPVNLGNPEELTVLGLAEEVLRMTRSRSKIRHLALPKDDLKIRCPNIDRARKELGFAPSVPLREGLKKTIDYFKRLLVGSSSRTISLAARLPRAMPKPGTPLNGGSAQR